MKAEIRCNPYDYTVWDFTGEQVGGSFTTIIAAETFLLKMGYTLFFPNEREV
jgi:hypothetical protein